MDLLDAIPYIFASSIITAFFMHYNATKKKSAIKERFDKLVTLTEGVIAKRDEYKSSYIKLIKEYNYLVDEFHKLAKEKSTNSAVNLYPRGCDKREVYKRLMNIYHPDKPNGCHKMSQEIQRQFKK